MKEITTHSGATWVSRIGTELRDLTKILLPIKTFTDTGIETILSSPGSELVRVTMTWSIIEDEPDLGQTYSIFMHPCELIPSENKTLIMDPLFLAKLAGRGSGVNSQDSTLSLEVSGLDLEYVVKVTEFAVFMQRTYLTTIDKNYYIGELLLIPSAGIVNTEEGEVSFNILEQTKENENEQQ